MFDKVPVYDVSDFLPAYKPSLHTFDIVIWKKELQSPFKYASDRKWIFAIVELNSTQLNIYKLNNIDNIEQYLHRFITGSTGKTTNLNIKNPLHCFLSTQDSLAVPFEIIQPYLGQLKKSYTLQGAKAGSAIDYHKKEFTLRLRCELNQFLFSFLNLKRFVNFFADFQTCAELSLPIEERGSLKIFKTVPIELSRFRVENFDGFYNSLSEKEAQENLNIFRKKTIEAVYLKDKDAIKEQENLSISSNIIPEKALYLSSDKYIDEHLIFSLTCIKKLEARKSWKGDIILTGNFSDKKLKQFQTKNNINRLVIDVEMFERFRKLVSSKNINLKNDCKKFKMIGCKLVEERGS